jgi:hypothetical protein
LFTYIDGDVITCVLILANSNPEVHQFRLSEIGWDSSKDTSELHMGVSHGFLVLCSTTEIWYADLIKILSLKIEASNALDAEDAIL